MLDLLQQVVITFRTSGEKTRICSIFETRVEDLTSKEASTTRSLSMDKILDSLVRQEVDLNRTDPF